MAIPTLHWSKNEVENIVAAYFSMLEDELNGKPINKTFNRNSLKGYLDQRSDGSIEFKHQNISAVLIKLGLPYIKGYKPKWNYQQILEENIIAYIEHHKHKLLPIFLNFSDSKIISFETPNFNSLLDSPPIKQFQLLDPNIEYERKPIKVNFLEREQNNTYIGQMGEKLILDYERWRLRNLGQVNLAESVEWVAQSDDSAGFDILSKNLNGSDLYIEVKTTKLAKETPFFFTKNEYEFSLNKKNDFHLYRLFNFNSNSKLFKVHGSFDQICNKEAIVFKGYF